MCWPLAPTLLLPLLARSRFLCARATQQREAFRSPPTSPYVCRRSRVIARVDLFQYLFVGVACDRRAVVRLGRFLLVVRLESGGVAPEDDANSAGGCAAMRPPPLLPMHGWSARYSSEWSYQPSGHL